MGDRARQLMVLWALALMSGVASLAGCSERETVPDMTGPSTWEPVSGSRLQARHLLTEDGLRIFDGWFDTSRGEYCRVARGQGNRYYCFPATNPVVFRDARCQQAVGQHLECAYRYTGVVRGDRRCGNDTLTLWEEGEPISLPSRYRLSNDFCAGPDTAEAGTFVSLTTRLAESALVSGEPFLARASLRLGPRVIRFQDGSTAPFEMYDNSQNRACVRVETDRGIRCLPESAVYVGPTGPYYADGACNERVAHVEAPACLTRASVALVTEVVNGCMRVREAYRPGMRLDPREVFSGRRLPGSGRIIPGHFYQLGERIDLSTFPELQAARDAGPAASACAPTARLTTWPSRRWASTSTTASWASSAGWPWLATASCAACRWRARRSSRGKPAAPLSPTRAAGMPLARYNPGVGSCQGAMPAMAGVLARLAETLPRRRRDRPGLARRPPARALGHPPPGPPARGGAVLLPGRRLPAGPGRGG